MIWGLLLLLVLLSLLGYNLWRTGQLRRLKFPQLQRRNGRPIPPASAKNRHVRGRNIPQARRSWRTRIREEVYARGKLGGLIFFLIFLLVFFLGLRVLGYIGTPDSPNPHLIAGVAPFNAPDGQSAPEGASAAENLIAEWSQGEQHRLQRPLELIQLRAQLPDAETAWATLQREKADVVLWGNIEPGGSANTNSITPRLLWSSRFTLPHDQSLLLRDRLATPVIYDLSLRPMNAEAILGQVLETLDAYQLGEYDTTISTINLLLDRYSVDGPLRPDLLLNMRGSIRGLQEQWAAAEGDFRRALEVTNNIRPEYWNNLGVALMMQGRVDEAREAFANAQREIDKGGGDVAAVHLNQGLLILQGNDPAAAVGELAKANELKPNHVGILLPLLEAQLHANQGQESTATANQLNTLAPNDPLVQTAISRWEIAQLVGTGDAPLWELEIARPLDRATLTRTRERFDQAVATLESQAADYRQRAASADAAGRPESGRVYEGAARQILDLLNSIRYWRSVAQTEEGIAAQRDNPGLLKRMWNGVFGDDPPLEQAQANLVVLSKTQENDYDIQTQTGRVYRLLNTPKNALERYTKATEINPNRPEAWYGLAVTRWQFEAESPERNAAIRDELSKSIAANSRYTPAYWLAARLEVREKQWAAALPYLQWLAQNRPDMTEARIMLGRVQREYGALADAELTLLPLANDNNGDALVELARVYRKAQQDDAADAVLRRALQVNAGNAVAAYELGHLHQDHGNYDVAEQAYNQAISANPNYMEAHLALGQLYGRYLNQPDKAVESYNRAIAVGGKDARNYEDLGNEFLEMGQYEEAANALAQSVKLNPNVPESRHALAKAYLELGRYDAAREQERAAIARKSDGVYLDAQVGIAESFRRQGRHDEAIAAYNQVLDTDPNNVGAYVGLGRTAADKQDWQAAIGYYNQALARNPDDNSAHFWLGQALVEQGFYERALDEFNIVLVHDPNNVQALYGAGRAYNNIAVGTYGIDDAQALEYDSKALDLLNQALARRPDYAEALFERGKLYERRGQINGAIADYGRAAELNPQNATALFYQGKLYLGQNNVEAAADALDTSVRRDPNNPEAIYWLGRAYRAQNKPAAAIKAFQKARELNPNYHEAHYFEGLTQEESTQIDAARAVYEELIKQAPADDPWRQQAEERLRALQK